MTAVLLNLAWGLLVGLSFVALGRILARGVWTECRHDLALAAGWGMAGMVVLGGILNLVGGANSAGLVGLVVAIIVLELLLTVRDLRGSAPPGELAPEAGTKNGRDGIRAAPWIFLVVALGAFKYASSLTVAFNEPDDQPAYMMQCARMLQTGSIGLDPFSDRQLLSLNGQTFLLALVGCICPMKYAFLLDPGLGWILLGGLTWSIVRLDLNGSIRDASMLTILIYLYGIPFINLSGYLTGAVLYLTLIRTSYLAMKDDGALHRSGLVMVALTVAALCALKTTYVYYGGLFMLAWLGSRIFKASGLIRLREMVLIGIMAALFQFPWMWQQHRSGGTFFYPFLGKGFHLSGGEFEAFRDSPVVKAKAMIYYVAEGQTIPALIATLFLAANPFEEDRARWRVLLAGVLSASVGSVVLSFYLASNAISRYTQAFLFAGLIPVGLFGLLGPRLTRGRAALALCLVGFLGLNWENLHSTLAHLAEFDRTPGPGRAYKDRDREQIRRAQAAIPPGKRILSWVFHGSLFDFNRNPIWNLDQGLTSPPPGIPVTPDRDALRGYLAQTTPEFPPPCAGAELVAYLQHTGIDFVIFQRGQGTRFGAGHTGPPPLKPYWNRLIHTFAVLMAKDMEGVRSRCKVAYDDGDIFVVDIRSPGGKGNPDG